MPVHQPGRPRRSAAGRPGRPAGPRFDEDQARAPSCTARIRVMSICRRPAAPGPAASKWRTSPSSPRGSARRATWASRTSRTRRQAARPGCAGPRRSPQRRGQVHHLDGRREPPARSECTSLEGDGLPISPRRGEDGDEESDGGDLDHGRGHGRPEQRRPTRPGGPAKPRVTTPPTSDVSSGRPAAGGRGWCVQPGTPEANPITNSQIQPKICVHGRGR